MKKAIAIIVLGLLWCNTVAASSEKLKGNFKCQSIRTQGEWTLSFSRKWGGAGSNYHIKKDNVKNLELETLKNLKSSKASIILRAYKVDYSDKISDKRFGQGRSSKLFWYYLLPIEGDKVLIANVLKLSSKSTPLNFESTIIFFDTDFIKEHLKVLEKASNKSELVFFNEANNFFHSKIKTNNLGLNANSGSWGYANSGSWESFDKAICKSDQL